VAHGRIPPHEAGSPPGPEPSISGPALFGRVRALQALQYREFRLLFLAQLTTAMAQWMDQVARGWLLYELTGSPFQLGLVGTLRIFPLLFLSPIAGTMADRYGRKTQLIASQSVNVVTNVVLGLLILQGGVEPWHIYATGAISSIVQVFQVPARQAMVPESVARTHLTGAIGLNSLAFNVSRSLGPALAGAVIAGIGAGGSYLIQSVIYLLSTMWTLQLRLPNRAPTAGPSRAQGGRSFVGSTVDGWRYIFHHVTIRSALGVSALTSIFGFSVTALLPVFAKDVLDAGATGQGLMLAAIGVGAVASAFFVASLGDDLPKGLMMIGGAGCYGLLIFLFANSQWLPLSLLLLMLSGICNVAATTLVQTVLQAESAPEMRGRVMGAYQQHHVLIAFGGLVAGALATVWGTQLTVGAFGMTCALGALLVLVAVPHVRAIR
jgi:MFS family permease